MRLALLLLVLFAGAAPAAEVSRYIASDSLVAAGAVDADVQQCLEGLCWSPETFEVRVEPATAAEHRALVRFPSPVDTGDPVNDDVAVLWYQPPGAGDGLPRPAIVVVHESGSAMPVGKLFANLFAGQGAHAFLVQLPHYGHRRKSSEKPTGDQFLLAMRQGIADVRRARDAVAALPGVDPTRISLQGTSLGGFVAGTTAGLDSAFDQVFIMVAGGDLYGLMQNGAKEAAELRDRLAKAGFTGDKLRDLMARIEPTRLASRLNPARTWLYSAEQDQVVPMANALAFKQAAGLADDHHVRLAGDHVSVIVYVPAILMHVMERVSPPPGPTPAAR